MTAAIDPSVSRAEIGTSKVFILSESFAADDARFFEAALEWMETQSPDWYRYLVEAAPLELSIEPEDDARGLAAKSRCCDLLGKGQVVFADHLDRPAVIGGQLDSTVEGRQIALLGTLIHEVTHIRERRAGQLPPRPDFGSCVAGEKSAFTQELAFKRAVAWPELSAAPDAAGLYQVAARHQLDSGSKALQALEAWDFFCSLVAREPE